MKRIVIILVLILLLTGCKAKDNNIISVANQFGLAYAPIEIMKDQGFLEKRLGQGYTVEWVQLANTTAIREAMLTGNLDIGFVGIPPFLIAKDNQMPWRIMTGLSSSPLGLVTNDETIKDLKDLIGVGKIALPQPGSIQHILLSMAADKQLGDPKAFDQQLISLSHPDGYQAMKAKSEVVAHFTAPPYLDQELNEEGFHMLLSGDEAFGGSFTFIVGVCMDSFYQDEKAYTGFIQALDDAYQFMAANPEESMEILSVAYHLDLEEVRVQMMEQGLLFAPEINGMEQFIGFMQKTGYLKNEIPEDELLWVR